MPRPFKFVAILFASCFFIVAISAIDVHRLNLGDIQSDDDDLFADQVVVLNNNDNNNPTSHPIVVVQDPQSFPIASDDVFSHPINFEDDEIIHDLRDVGPSHPINLDDINSNNDNNNGIDSGGGMIVEPSNYLLNNVLVNNICRIADSVLVRPVVNGFIHSSHYLSRLETSLLGTTRQQVLMDLVQTDQLYMAPVLEELQSELIPGEKMNWKRVSTCLKQTRSNLTNTRSLPTSRIRFQVMNRELTKHRGVFISTSVNWNAINVRGKTPLVDSSVRVLEFSVGLGGNNRREKVLIEVTPTDKENATLLVSTNQRVGVPVKIPVGSYNNIVIELMNSFEKENSVDLTVYFMKPWWIGDADSSSNCDGGAYGIVYKTTFSESVFDGITNVKISDDEAVYNNRFLGIKDFQIWPLDAFRAKMRGGNTSGTQVKGGTVFSEWIAKLVSMLKGMLIIKADNSSSSSRTTAPPVIFKLFAYTRPIFHLDSFYLLDCYFGREWTHPLNHYIPGE